MESSVVISGRRSLRACLFTIFLLVASPAAHAAESVSFCFNDWPPYTQIGDEGPEGITVQIVQRAADMLGLEARFFEHSWDDCLQKVEDGEYDVLLDAAKREAYLQGPTSFNSYTDTFWVRNDSKVNRYDELTGGKIALVKGYNYADSLMAHIDDLGLEIVRGEDDPSNIRDLADGKIDAVIADLASTFVYTNENKLQVHPILPPFSVDLLYASFNRELLTLQQAFDRTFAQLLEQGYVDEVYKSSIGTTYSSFIKY